MKGLQKSLIFKGLIFWLVCMWVIVEGASASVASLEAPADFLLITSLQKPMFVFAHEYVWIFSSHFKEMFYPEFFSLLTVSVSHVLHYNHLLWGQTLIN